MAVANGPYTGTTGSNIAFSSAGSADPDGDPLTFSWAFGDGATSTEANPQHAFQSAGVFPVRLTVADGKGGQSTTSADATVVAPAVTLTGISLSPEFLRFSVVGADRPLSVIGQMSDGSSVDLTNTTDTTYESTNAFVAAVNASGVAHSVGNGSATITARHGQFTDAAAVTVEAGVVLDTLDLTAPVTVLRSIGASVAVTLRGQFSDGETRDLTTAEGTVYDSGDPHVASVDASGRVTAVAVGDVIITAHHDEASATIAFHVAISTGTGLLRGQVLDDSRGLPLAGATVALLADGGGSLPVPATTTADERGRFELAGRAGDAVVAVTKPGFTVVERRAAIPAGRAITLLDARLTPIDTFPNAMTSAFGGEAHDRSGLFRLVIPPGGIAAAADFTLTPISAQGLEGRLPLGWSPIVAVDLAPGDLALGQAGSLTVPNVASLAANAEVTVVAYDRVRHDWMVTAVAHVGTDGRSIVLPLNVTGQIVCLAADDPPFVPAGMAPGNVLTGLSSPAPPGDVTTSGDVVPRSAPPGDQAKAIGRVLAGHANALPSGTVLRASVSERFDLSDRSQVVPPSFTEDLVLFARGRPLGDGGVGATFPITPSRSYTIQELLRGVVSIDVATPTDEPAAPLIGAAGGAASDASGDSLEVPAGALTRDTIVDVRRVSADTTLAAPAAGYDLIAAIDVDFIGAGLAQSGRLSTPAPHDVAATDQILLAMAFRDATGVLRSRLVGSASLSGDRLVSQSAIGTLAVAGVVSAGQYMFLRPQLPIGFVTGRAFGADGTTPHAQALITSDTAPFADLASALGQFVVAGRAGVDVVVSGLDTATHDAGAGSGHVNARDQIVSVNVTLAASAPKVTATDPIAGATNVPLDTSVIIDFSDAIDPASLSAGSVLLQAGGPAGGQAILSSDHRRLVFRPDTPLAGKTIYTLSLSGLRAQTGRLVSAFAPITFKTLDPSKVTLGVSGLINGDLPDENGLVLVTGGAGAADASAPVTATNLRTQETTTVIAGQDGSFRLRLSALIGDAIALTLRDASGRSTTITLSQLRGADGTTTVSERGGTILGTHGRTGTILPRALTQPGIFRLADAAGGATMPGLPDGFGFVDQFHLSSQAAQFNRVSSLTLSESQNRFPPQAPPTTPFVAEGELTVPADFLINASLRFTATAVDASGVSRAVTGSTMVVAAGADASVVENGQLVDFPTVFVEAPRQTLQNQVITIDAAAPAARIDLELPSPDGADGAAALLLVRRAIVGGAPKLSVVDLLSSADRGGEPVLRTSGREFPGMSSTGDYAVVSSAGPIVFVRGRLTGAAAVATLDGSPFVFETDGPNGTFALPVAAGQPFTLQYLDAASGAVIGTSSGTAPATGAVDLGTPLASPGSRLSVTVEPDARQVVDINQPITFHFSEPIDGRTAPAGIIVTDGSGARVSGGVTLSNGNLTATFRPSRRWRFAITYRWGVATSVIAASGARMTQQASGEFTTFTPRVISTTPVGMAQDVAIAGSLAVVATATGIATVDTAAALKPAIQAQMAFAGGAQGVASLPAPSFTDRTGQVHEGSFVAVAVAAGNAGDSGRLEIVDVSTATTPASIGTTSLTAGSTPSAVAATADGRAIVAVPMVGVASVEIGAAVPANPANPGGAVRQRYPSTGSDGINQTAVLGDRVVAVGPGGLTVLDATTLERRGGVSTTADARGVASLAAFAADLNGDGTIDVSETFDLTVVANGADGTLQFFQTPTAGNPTLLSVVHLPAETSSVVLDGNERLAYVGLGARGVALVDLDGPASIQPIDFDRNGVDDRILGIVDTPGEAGRLALALDRGMAFVADGSAGMTAVQVLPPRVTFVTLKRDPVAALSGDEESILDTRTALSTDEAILVGLQVIVSPGDSASLTLDEQTAGSQAMSFAGGSTTAALQTGLNSLKIAIARGAAPGTHAILTPRSGAGAAFASTDVTLASSDPGAATLDSLVVVPAAATLDAGVTDLQVSVAGFFSDNKVRNLTTAATGTSYAVQHPAVVDIGADGVVQPLGGGSSLVSATNRAVVGFTAVTVERAPVLTRLSADPDSMTLRDAGVRRPSPIVGILSDGSTVPASSLENVAFATSDPTIVAIDASGELTAVGEGLATISAISGSLRADVIVDDDFRRPASITSIALDVPSGTVSPDTGPILLSARLGGSGSLDGLSVSFVFSGAAAGAVTEVTNIEGTASAELQSVAAGGNVGVTASVIDPATGATRTASASLTLAAVSGDNEPNGDPASASPLTDSQPVQGHVDANGDASDTFNIRIGADSVATITLTLDANAVLSGVTLVIRSASGQEIARITPTGATTQVQQPLPAGAASISVETSAGAFGYQLSVSTNQVDVTIAAVAPSSASAGTAVTITGTGFSTVADDTTVLFGGVEGKVLSVNPTQIVALVPANAVNGPLEVISGDRRAAIPAFQAGNSLPRPAAFVQPHNPAALRRDPTSGLVLDITRVVVSADPLASLAQIAAIAARLGGGLVGFIPSTHTYVMEFPANATFDGLASLIRQAQTDPLVASAQRSILDQLDSRKLDTLDMEGTWPNRSVALHRWFEVIHAGQAIDAVRTTSPFDQRGNLKSVTPAVIDDGFNPQFLNAQFVVNGSSVVQSMTMTGSGFQAVAAPGVSLPGRHGTQVSSIIIEPNNGTAVSGILNSLVQPDEDPFQSVMYNALAANGSGIDREVAWAAIDHIAARADVPVLNLSFGSNLADDKAEFAKHRDKYRQHVKLLRGKTLVVISAGNDNVVADYQSPAVLSRTMKHVMAVGATAVADVDGSGEGEDARADFGGSKPGFVAGNVACGPKAKVIGGSNCGATLNIAAPGEDVLAAQIDGPLGSFDGTSASAPVVAGVAALLQSIRPEQAFLKPDLIRQLLIDTADDISDKWSPGRMVRVNALKAVHAVLSGGGPLSFYVSDNELPTANAIGGIVSVGVDPLTGAPATGPGKLTTIDLAVTSGHTTLQLHHPTSSIVSPAGEWLYAVAKSDDTLGDGIVVINTQSLKPRAFIPLSGASFPLNPAQPPPPAVNIDNPRPGLALSKDGRLLYVSAGDRLVIVNTEGFVVVKRFVDMPRDTGHRHRAMRACSKTASSRSRRQPRILPPRESRRPATRRSVRSRCRLTGARCLPRSRPGTAAARSLGSCCRSTSISTSIRAFNSTTTSRPVRRRAWGRSVRFCAATSRATSRRARTARKSIS